VNLEQSNLVTRHVPNVDDVLLRELRVAARCAERDFLFLRSWCFFLRRLCSTVRAAKSETAANAYPAFMGTSFPRFLFVHDRA
jgi:hypothetical protein